MQVLLVGHGGREAALAWRISQSPTLERLTVVGRNPGWPHSADLVETKGNADTVSYTHLRAHETREDLVCRLLLEKKK